MNTQILRRAAIGLLSSAILLAPTPAKASHYYEQLRQQFVAVAEQLELSITHELYTDTLNAGDKEVVSLNLRRGTSYIIVGLCDESCSDIDMGLYSPNGDLLGYDTDYSDHPVIAVTPRTSGEYRVVVKMQTCSTSSCDYGIGVLSR